MKRTGTRPGGRLRSKRRLAPRRNPKTPSPKAVEVVRLVEALTAGVASHDGVVVGHGIAELLRDAYRERQRPVPRWVRELIGYYAREKRAR